jgi:hypothetical protein
VGTPMDTMSAIPYAQQASAPNVAMPPPSYNAGLYTGQPFAGPWGNIPVTPTAAGHTNVALQWATPPPHATSMYSTGATNRPGNSFSAKPGVYNYNGGLGEGMYNIKCTSRKSGGGGGRGRRRGMGRSMGRRHPRRRQQQQKRRGGLNLRSANMDEGAPFHPTWTTAAGADATGGGRGGGRHRSRRARSRSRRHRRSAVSGRR